MNSMGLIRLVSTFLLLLPLTYTFKCHVGTISVAQQSRQIQIATCTATEERCAYGVKRGSSPKDVEVACVATDTPVGWGEFQLKFHDYFGYVCEVDSCNDPKILSCYVGTKVNGQGKPFPTLTKCQEGQYKCGLAVGRFKNDEILKYSCEETDAVNGKRIDPNYGDLDLHVCDKKSCNTELLMTTTTTTIQSTTGLSTTPGTTGDFTGVSECEVGRTKDDTGEFVKKPCRGGLSKCGKRVYDDYDGSIIVEKRCVPVTITSGDSQMFNGSLWYVCDTDLCNSATQISKSFTLMGLMMMVEWWLFSAQ